MSAPSSLHHVVLLDPGNRRLLALETPAGRALPAFAGGDDEPGVVAPLHALVKAGLGLGGETEITTLRCLARHRDPLDGKVEQVVALELRGALPEPAGGGAWIGRDELAALPWDHPGHLSLAAAALDDVPLAGQPPLPAWSRSGWWDEASGWIRDRLREAGCAGGMAIEQVRVWEFSTVIRVRGAAGEWYFKAVPLDFACEPLLTARLARWHSGRLPPVTAGDAQRRCFLMPAVSGPLLNEVSDLAPWTLALRDYAQLQIESSRRLPELAALGVPGRTLAVLEAEIAPLLADEGALGAGEPGGLSGGEIGELRRRAPALAAACRELAGCGLPDALEHGDLWAGNIVVTPGGPVFLDWTDASLGHPFLSLPPLLAGLPIHGRLAHVPAAAERLRDAYLEPWSAWGDPLALRRAFELAQPVAALHHAVHYRRDILPLLATSVEVRDLIPLYLRALLPPTV